MSMNTQRAFLTVEVVIALAIFTVIMSGAVLVSFNGQTAGLDTALTKETVYQAQSFSQNDMQLASVFSGFSALTSSVNAAAGYTRTVTNGAPCFKIVGTSFSTSTEKNRSLSAGILSGIASIDTAVAMGGGCDPFPPSDWDNPDSFGSIDVGGSAGTGVEARWISGIRHAFLVSNPSAANQEDFYVFNVADPENPTEDAKINTGAGLNDIAIEGKYAFVLQDDYQNQLQVIDISDPTGPFIETEVTLQDVDGTYPEGRTIAYFDNTLYIGTWNNNIPATSPEFLIYDVSSPSAPAFLGSLNVGHSVNEIVVNDSYAYLATTDDAGELTIVDITSPSIPTVVGKYDAPWSGNDAESVSLSNSVVYLGREKASSGDYDFLSVDVSDPAIPVLLGKLRFEMNGANAVVSGIVTQGKYAFVGTTDTNDEFRVLDVSDPSNPAPYGCPPYNYSAKVNDLVYLDNFIFVSNESNDALRIIYDDPIFQCH